VKILFGIIGTALVLMVVAYVFPIIWPLVTDAGADITSMNGTDAGTTTVIAFWPVVLLMVGLGIAIGLVMFALRKFGILGGSSI